MLITGSSGFIGSALKPRLLAAGHHFESLRRGPAWDPPAGRIDPAAVEGFDAVVHLAGEGIGDHRWSAAHKRRVLDSRVNGTTALARALAQRAEKPAVLISASGIDYYEDRGDEPVTEESGRGDDFLAEVCVAWEAATAPADEAGIRVVHLRTGLVLGPGGGALKSMLRIFKLGLGGRLGSGRQYWSWITLDDEVGAIVHALEHAAVTGPLNAVAPAPVTNAEFTATLARVLHRPAVLRVPRAALAVRFGAEMTDAMLLTGQRVLPAKLEATGYEFRHPELEGALRSML